MSEDKEKGSGVPASPSLSHPSGAEPVPVSGKAGIANAGHTPGPWIVNPAEAWVEVPEADAPICALLWPTEIRSEGETFANARLIAAAPELLAALKSELVAINEDIRWACDSELERLIGRREAIEAAIAKAEGR